VKLLTSGRQAAGKGNAPTPKTRKHRSIPQAGGPHEVDALALQAVV